MSPHPAKFSDQLMPVFQTIVDAYTGENEYNALVLDPFAGTGRIHELERCYTVGVEIEPEWADLHPRTQIGDATCLPARWTNRFKMVLTSPTYGNRMADSHTPSPSDTSKRITYTHKLGRELSPLNTGGMQWGGRYRVMHRAAWHQARRVLVPGGYLVINIKDHIRKGEVVPVSAWHLETCKSLGFELIEDIEVPCPGMRFGANGGARVEVEHVYVLQIPNPKPDPQLEILR